jgi:predicted nucleic acid-binding protein
VKVFFDTNILIYAASGDPRRVAAAQVLREGGVISVQVLNEFTNVCRKKLRLDWQDIEEAIMRFSQAVEDVLPLTLATHSAGVELARDHGLAFYDALIVAAAREAGYQILYSEDLQHDRRFDDLSIVNPFRS